MGIYTSGYSVKLQDIMDIDTKEKEAYTKMYIDELKEELKREEGVDDEGLSEFEEFLTFEESAMRQIFGLGQCNKKRTDSIIMSIEWICDNFGYGLGGNYEMPPIYELAIKTRLSDEFVPPFGFPASDENVSHLTLEQIKEERKQLEGCDQQTFDETDGPRWIFDQEKLDEAKNVWNTRILPARKHFLGWLDHCIRENTDLVIIQS